MTVGEIQQSAIQELQNQISGLQTNLLLTTGSLDFGQEVVKTKESSILQLQLDVDEAQKNIDTLVAEKNALSAGLSEKNIEFNIVSENLVNAQNDLTTKQSLLESALNAFNEAEDLIELKNSEILDIREQLDQKLL